MNIKRFKYTKLLDSALMQLKTEVIASNREAEKNDRLSASSRISRMRATRKINNLINTLIRSDNEREQLVGKELKLEREYIRKYEKRNLLVEIERKTKQPAGGSYTLAEIGDILGITRERVRQIEASAVKLLKHPSVLRALKEMKNE